MTTNWAPWKFSTLSCFTHSDVPLIDVRPNKNYDHMETGPRQKSHQTDWLSQGSNLRLRFISYTTAAPRRMGGCLSRPRDKKPKQALVFGV